MAAQEPRPIGWTGPTGAKVVRHVRAFAALDNHTPARRTKRVTLEEYEWPPSDDGFIGVQYRIVGGLDVFPYGAKALWLLDDGQTVRVMYTAAHHPTERYIGVKDFTPTGFGFGCGPTVAYHLKVTEV